jgi:hypothetical protein
MFFHDHMWLLESILSVDLHLSIYSTLSWAIQITIPNRARHEIAIALGPWDDLKITPKRLACGMVYIYIYYWVYRITTLFNALPERIRIDSDICWFRAGLEFAVANLKSDLCTQESSTLRILNAVPRRSKKPQNCNGIVWMDIWPWLLMDVSVWMGPHLRGKASSGAGLPQIGPTQAFQFGRVQQRLIFQQLLLSFRRTLHLSPRFMMPPLPMIVCSADIPVVEPLFVGYIPCFCTGYKWPQNDCSCQRKSCHLQLGHHLDMSLSEDLGENM